jgi:hypothetical protein
MAFERYVICSFWHVSILNLVQKYCQDQEQLGDTTQAFLDGEGHTCDPNLKGSCRSAGTNLTRSSLSDCMCSLVHGVSVRC